MNATRNLKIIKTYKTATLDCFCCCHLVSRLLVRYYQPVHLSALWLLCFSGLILVSKCHKSRTRSRRLCWLSVWWVSRHNSLLVHLAWRTGVLGHDKKRDVEQLRWTGSPTNVSAEWYLSENNGSLQNIQVRQHKKLVCSRFPDRTSQNGADCNIFYVHFICLYFIRYSYKYNLRTHFHASMLHVYLAHVK